MNSVCKKMAVYVAIVAFVVMTPLATNADDKSEYGAQARVSGHGQKHTAQHVVSSRDIAAISYPQAQVSGNAEENAEAASPLRSRSLLLIQPRRFDREGVYIWRDPEGVWQIQAVSGQQLAVTGRVEAQESIVPTATRVNAASTFNLVDSKPNVASFAVTGALQNDAASVQFKAEGAYLDFNIQINGKADPGHIYIGSRGINPAAIPFRLENRATEASRAGDQTQTAEPSRPAPNVAEVTVETGPEGAHQAASRGGSSGGSGGHIAQKPIYK